MEMSESINQRIIDKIDESAFDEWIKGFLRTVLLNELANFEEGKPRFSDEYDRTIDQYLEERRKSRDVF